MSTPFQAKFTGSHSVVKHAPDHNYLISNPGYRRPEQLCHVHLVKPYNACSSSVPSADQQKLMAVPRLGDAPATFQHLVNRVVAGLEGHVIYLDDLVVYSDSWVSHMQRVRALFDGWVEANSSSCNCVILGSGGWTAVCGSCACQSVGG